VERFLRFETICAVGGKKLIGEYIRSTYTSKNGSNCSALGKRLDAALEAVFETFR